ncbi:hypothetical protein J437_LFUL004771 [Ladona fulva]|uniref:Uncharacterized protein n=1 Tax=Ladona fulva TaxID=123851 RepID=A0A8K0K052_LADFU|nr:hypothetical protein J437_LFUL004771 [Ladona fulva]
MMSTFNNVYQSLVMEVNSAKTMLLVMKCHAPLSPQIETAVSLASSQIEEVDQFSYLGSLVTSKGDMDTEINHRFQCAAHAFYKLRKRVFKNKDLSAKTKVAVFKAVVLSVLLYINECWIRYKKHVFLRNSSKDDCEVSLESEGKITSPTRKY